LSPMSVGWRFYLLEPVYEASRNIALSPPRA
jgi:hypothetical protein